jgi:hypothetical protein
VSIEADPALGVPYGNGLHFPGVFGKWYLYVVPEGHFCALPWTWFDGVVTRSVWKVVFVCSSRRALLRPSLDLV